MRKRYWLLVFMVIAFAAEYFFVVEILQKHSAFPGNGVLVYRSKQLFARCAAFGRGRLLYLRRTRIRDRVKRYFPVVVTGVLYLGVTAFMVHQLRLDGGVVTALAILAGLNNNIFCGACNCHVLPQMGRAHHENGVFCRLFFVGSYCNF